MAIAKDLVKEGDAGYRNLLKISDLVSTHSDYDDYVEEWRMMLAVYEGIKWIKYYGYIEQHEREQNDAYVRRLKELYSLAYSRSIVNIFHYYLFKKDPKRTLGALQDDESWKSFVKDANLYGDSFDEVMMDAALYASIEGHVGLLVDMPCSDKGTFVNIKQQKVANIYPYIARYFPASILDWEWGHDEFGKPCLTHLKLVDDDGQYRLWWRDKWEIWELPEEGGAKPTAPDGYFQGRGQRSQVGQMDNDMSATFIANGINPLGEIPFVWHYNARTKLKGIGRSDITEVSRIDLSIIRNLSQAEEIINYAAFPMLLKPMRSADPRQANAAQAEDVVAPDAVQEFDPENPQAKPEWMKTEVEGPLKAIIEFINTKIAEIYRSTNTGGMAATEVSTEAKSGAAMTAEFKLLNSHLVTKAILLEKTETKVVELWLKWNRLWDRFKKEINLQRDRDFDIDNLAQDLANAVLAKTVVLSKTFNKLVQQQSARQMLPGATEENMINIDKEIEDSVEAEDIIIDANEIEDDDFEELGDAIDEKGEADLNKKKKADEGKGKGVKRVKSPDSNGKSTK